MNKVTVIPFSPVIFMFGSFLLLTLLHIASFSEGYRAAERNCPPHIAEVILQKN